MLCRLRSIHSWNPLIVGCDGILDAKFHLCFIILASLPYPKELKHGLVCTPMVPANCNYNGDYQMRYVISHIL